MVLATCFRQNSRPHQRPRTLSWAAFASRTPRLGRLVFFLFLICVLLSFFLYVFTVFIYFCFLSFHLSWVFWVFPWTPDYPIDFTFSKCKHPCLAWWFLEHQRCKTCCCLGVAPPAPPSAFKTKSFASQQVTGSQRLKAHGCCHLKYYGWEASLGVNRSGAQNGGIWETVFPKKTNAHAFSTSLAKLRPGCESEKHNDTPVFCYKPFDSSKGPWAEIHVASAWLRVNFSRFRATLFLVSKTNHAPERIPYFRTSERKVREDQLQIGYLLFACTLCTWGILNKNLYTYSYRTPEKYGGVTLAQRGLSWPLPLLCESRGTEVCAAVLCDAEEDVELHSVLSIWEEIWEEKTISEPISKAAKNKKHPKKQNGLGLIF